MTAVGDLHIDDFCKDSARILLALYKRFPVKTTLYVEDISGPDQPDEFGLHSPRFEACFATMLWLQENDYLYYGQTIRQEALEAAVLSHRCFALLSSLALAADSLVNPGPARQQHEAIAPLRRVDQLTHTLKHGNSEQLKALVLEYFRVSRDFR